MRNFGRRLVGRGVGVTQATKTLKSEKSRTDGVATTLDLSVCHVDCRRGEGGGLSRLSCRGHDTTPEESLVGVTSHSWKG